MRRVHRSHNKYLLMTTRQHIIEQARQIYDRLSDPSVSVSRYLLDLVAYTRDERAHILYNHIYFSGLSLKHREAIVKSKIYLKLTDSANFNPRLVELAIDLALHQNISADGIAAFLGAAFDNPHALWQHVMENQLTLAQKWILAFLALDFGHSTEQVRILEQHYYAADFGLDTRRTLEEELRTLEGLTIRIADSRVGVVIRLLNPGVVDGIKEFILSQSSLFEALLPSLATWEQASSLWNTAFEKIGDVSWPQRYGESATGNRHGLLPPIGIQEARRPGLVALVQGHIRPFVQTMARCACRGTYSMGSRYYSDQLEGRLSTLIELLPSLIQEPIGDLLAEPIGRIRLRWKENRGDKRAAVDLVAALEKTNLVDATQKGNLLAEGQRFLQVALNHDPNDYLALRLLATGEVRFSRTSFEYPMPEDIEQEFLDFVQSSVSDLRNEDLSQVRGELEELESVARVMDIDIDDELRDIWMQVGRAESASEYDDYNRIDPQASSGVETGGDDFAHNLFGSLT
jgi:hypothetical protein